MKRIKKILFAAVFASTAVSANAAVISGNSLQDALDGLATDGTIGIDVDTDQVALDEYWLKSANSEAAATVILELSGNAGSNVFGVFDATDPSKSVQLFSGGASAGSDAELTILLDGSVLVNDVDTGVDFSGNLFGFYLSTPSGVFYSDTSMNGGDDHMVAYQGNGEEIQIANFIAGPFLSNEYIFGWEDESLGGLGGDYDDFIVLIESIAPTSVSEPGGIALLALGLSGLGFARRRRIYSLNE